MTDLLVSALTQVVIFTLIPFVWWLITTIAARAHHKSTENFVNWLGLKKPEGKKLGRSIIIALVGACIYVAAMAVIQRYALGDVESATSQFAGKGLSAIPSILIYAVIQTSLSEEIIFRGFLGKRLIKKLGFKAGNALQATAFGLVHGIPFFMVTGNLAVLVLVTLIPAVMGYFMGYMNEKTAGGSIVPGWIMHASLNILSGIAACL